MRSTAEKDWVQRIYQASQTARAVQEHVQGKQYLGWSAIREKLKELQGRFGAVQPERPRSKDMDRERERERERPR